MNKLKKRARHSSQPEIGELPLELKYIGNPNDNIGKKKKKKSKKCEASKPVEAANST